MIKFIHCADIHLGKVQNNLEQRFEDFGAAFEQVVAEALNRQVQFLLIAGDLFDKRNINARTLEQAVRILEPLREARIPVIAIEGNHDKAFLRDKESWMSFLANRGYIILLNPAFEGGKLVMEPYDQKDCTGCYLDLPDDVRVYGLGYLGRMASDKLQEFADNLTGDKTNILLLHAMVGRMGGEMIGSISKVDVACLQEKVTYLALGHGHNRYVVEKVLRGFEEMAAVEVESKEEETIAFDEILSIIPVLHEENVFGEAEDYSESWGHNPGSVEHCRLEEASHIHGFFYVEMERKKLTKVEHIISNQRAARLITIDITGSSEPETAYEQILKAVKAETVELINPLLRLIIKGEIEFDILEIDEEWIRSQVQQICAPLILEIDIRANLPQFSISTETELLDRQSIECEVLRKKVEDRAQWRHLGDHLVNLILEIKDDVLNGLPTEEVAAKVLHMVGENNENS